MNKLLLLLIAISVSSFAEVPEEVKAKLSSVAKEHDCTPLSELERVDQSLGPWVHPIAVITGKKHDFAFICEINKKEFEYKVILVADTLGKKWAGCPKEIYAGFSAPSPSTLKIFHTIPETSFPNGLAEFISEDGEAGPSKLVVTGPIIDTSNFDLGVMLYCHNKKWYGKFVH